MTHRLSGAGLFALGLVFASPAQASETHSMARLQPGMLTMMQQGGQEHGVQSGPVLPCSTYHCPSRYGAARWSHAEPAVRAGVPARRRAGYAYR